MVAKAAPKKSSAVKKDITKTTKSKIATVSKDFEIDEDARYTGKVMHYDLKRGFGFIQLSQSGVAPDDKVMVHWRAIKSDDRWPFLKKEMNVELSLCKKKQTGGEWALRAVDVTLPGGDDVCLQEEKDEKREYVGDRNMRFLGDVKFFDFKKGFGYVVLQSGYDISDDVPTEIRVSRDEINAGEDCPRLSNNLEVEFGIAKNLRGQYTCYNMTLPGGQEITRSVAENRENESEDTYQGEVAFWSGPGAYGMITPDNLDDLPSDMQTMIKKDVEKRKKKSDGKGVKMAIFFRRADRIDPNGPVRRGQKVSYRLYTDNQGVGAFDVTEL